MHLIDLESGVDRRFDVPLGPVDDFAMMVWSPDSRWLFVVGGGGRLYAIDSSTGRVSDLGIPLPPVDQLAVRNAAWLAVCFVMRVTRRLRRESPEY